MSTKLQNLTWAACTNFLVQVNYDYGRDGHDTPQDALLWFLANKQSEESLDSLSSRNWAQLFKDGIPKLQLSDVNDWLNDLVEDFEDQADPKSSALEYAEDQLREFFGLSPEA